jgi:glycosyltransferase involved in cell wall biosynthesis
VARTYGVAAERICVVPHGHYRGVYGSPVPRGPARTALGLGDVPGRLFLHLGLLRPYKGVDDLLDAWAAHAARHPSDRLLVAGKPLDAAYGRRLAERAAAAPHVDLRLGFVPDDDIPAFYGAADVVVLPFRNITTSGSLLLAMSYARPVVAPSAPGLCYVLDGADDLLYDPDAPLPEALVRALDAAATAPLDALAARTRVACDRLDWTRIAQQTRAVYVGA